MKPNSLFISLLILSFSACVTKPDGIALVGGGLLDTTQPQMLIIDDSIIMVKGTFIRASGHRSITPLPASAEKIDVKGKFLIPIPAAVEESQLDVPALDMEKFVEQVSIRRPLIVGIPLDSTQWERHIIALMRAQRIRVFPRLAKVKPGVELERAKKNTKILVDEDIKICIPPGPDAEAEIAMLSQVGLDNKQLVRAYLSTASLGSGSDANISVIRGNPLTNWKNMFQVERRMLAGEWQAGR